MRLAVITDLHANARALTAVLERAHARGFDRLLILGDLLTYGIDGEQVLELVETELERGASLVLGNHDQLYIDLAANRTDYLAKLPGWIRESVDRAMTGLDLVRFAGLPWQLELQVEQMYFSHANPFGPRDWTYLYDEPALARAAATLTDRGFVLGAFGHTHRKAILRLPATTVVVAGSVGQPRDGEAGANLLWIESDGGVLVANHELVGYDIHGHIKGLRSSGLTEPTLTRLCRFFTDVC